MNTEQEIKNHQERCNETRKRLIEHKVLGPFIDEPDRVEFEHKGLFCLAVRNPDMFNWCGYVGLPPGHKFYGKDKKDLDIEVHGGLTYGKECRGPICHLTEDEDNLYWLGFDCLHSQDAGPGFDLVWAQAAKYELSPEWFERPSSMGIYNSRNTYRDLTYVMNETKSLAEQLL